MRKTFSTAVVVLFLSISALSMASVVDAVTCPRGYDVNENGECYIETKYADDSKSMQERCAEFFPPECCQQPLYTEDPACLYHDVDRMTQLSSPPNRPFTHPESTQIHQAVYDCLKAVGPFSPEQAEGVQENAQKCLASGDCTLQRNPASGHNCGLQSSTSSAGAIWEGIKARDRKPSGLVREAKAANNYGWYDFAAASLKAEKGKEAAKEFAQEAERRSAQETAGQEPQLLSTRFGSLGDRATAIPWRAFDQNGNSVPEAGLEGNTPVLLKAKLDNIAKGQPFSQEMPKESLLQKAIMVPAEPISATEMTFTLNAKPQDLKMPEPSRYDVKSTFGLELTKQGQEVHPLSEALFYIKQPGGKLLRYDENRRDWTPLESQSKDGGFVARSPGNSYFAIVVEKTAGTPSVGQSQARRLGDGWFLVAILTGIALGLAFFQWRTAVRRLKEMQR